LNASHTFSLRQARRRLYEILRRAESGEEFVITRRGTPVARLQPADTRPRRRLGILNGQFTIPPDFDAPVPEIEDLFEGLADDSESS
jgi:prevent-host-death family protein